MRLFPFLFVSAAILSACAQARSTFIEGPPSGQDQPVRFLRAGEIPFPITLDGIVKPTEKSMYPWQKAELLALGKLGASPENVFKRFGLHRVDNNDLLSKYRLKRWIVYVANNVKPQEKAQAKIREILVTYHDEMKILEMLQASLQVSATADIAKIFLDGLVQHWATQKKSEEIWELLRLDEQFGPKMLTNPSFYSWALQMQERHKNSWFNDILEFMTDRFIKMKKAANNNPKLLDRMKAAAGEAQVSAVLTPIKQVETAGKKQDPAVLIDNDMVNADTEDKDLALRITKNMVIAAVKDENNGVHNLGLWLYVSWRNNQLKKNVKPEETPNVGDTGLNH